MRHGIGSWCALAVLAPFLMLLSLAPAFAQAGFDRRGGDYAHFDIKSGDPEICAARCERDSRCLAWTFSYPRTANASASCFLKNKVTARTDDTCCVSGVRGAGVAEPRIGTFEFAIDRFGADYRNFEVTPPDASGAACKDACTGDNKCRAWTYLRPGYVGAPARCYLKDRITKPLPRPCCISGVVR